MGRKAIHENNAAKHRAYRERRARRTLDAATVATLVAELRAARDLLDVPPGTAMVALRAPVAKLLRDTIDQVAGTLAARTGFSED